MKKIQFLLLVIPMLLLQSCIKENEFDLDINVKLVYDGEPLVMFEDYVYPTGEMISFSRYSFYMTNIALNHVDGQDEIKDAEYFNFTSQNIDKAGAEEGLTISYRDLTKKEYDQMFFMIGVDDTNNAKTPATFLSDNPLSKPSEYWPGWGSYIFSKTEGQIDLGGAERTGVSLHTGGDNASASFLVQTDGLSENPKETIDIVIDLKKTFDNKGEIYDIGRSPSIHSANQIDEVQELVNNLKGAVTAQKR